MKERLVVIGNGMAGMKVVEEILEGHPERFSITVFGSEPYGNYNRIMLSPVLCGEKTVKDIMINDRDWYAEHGIELLSGEQKTVIKIDRLRCQVLAKDGTVAGYDRLLIATGSTPFILPVPGHNLEGVISFRDMDDVETMLRYSRHRKYAVVLGGGLLGLEAANGLRAQGMSVTVVHNNDCLLNRQLDHQAGKLLEHEMGDRGIEFRLSTQARELLGDESGHVRQVRFDDGTQLECDLFVMAIGVRPNFTLARDAGLHCERGIVVSDTLQTFDPRIYAVGECVQHRGETFGLVAPLYDQAKVCANHLCQHGVASYETLPLATKLKVSGIDLFSVGEFQSKPGLDELRFFDRRRSVYRKLLLRGDRLVGAVLYGDTRSGHWYQSLIESKSDIRHIRHALVFGQAVAESLITPEGLAVPGFDREVA